MAFLTWLANTAHNQYDSLLTHRPVIWPDFREIVQILIKPSNPLILGSGMVNC